MNLRFFIFAFAAICAVGGAGPVTAQKHAHDQLVPCDSTWITLLVVRHADRAGKADSLSAAGVVRAQELAHVAGAAGVTAIYHSDTKRTHDTAAPLATGRGIIPEVYPARDVAGLLVRICRDHPAETVLVVGHSNTVPMIIAAAGGPSMPDLPDDGYDDLFVLRVDACRMDPASLIHLRYGAPSP